jgi:hypothetical protein
MIFEFLFDLNLWMVIGGSIILFALLAELGYRIGRRSREKIDADGKSYIGTIQGALLGLLALLLGFTFAMAMSRFDTRKSLMLEEANAIGTAYLRAQLYPESRRQDVADHFRRYVDVRLEFYRAGNDEKKIEEARKKTEKIHDQLWSFATAWGQEDSRSIPMGLFLESLNEVIDMHAKRLTAMKNHVPEIILILLYFVAMAAIGLLGYGCGVGGSRNYLVTFLVPIVIAAVILVIFDLDRPRRGLIKVSLQSMVDLRQSLGDAKP